MLLKNGVDRVEIIDYHGEEPGGGKGKAGTGPTNERLLTFEREKWKLYLADGTNSLLGQA